MRMDAAVLWEVGRPVEIVEVELEPPKRSEILVKIAACGVCASDLHVVDGDLQKPLPIVLGHEAAGVVAEVGPEVESVAPGDHVALSLVPACGRCRPCRRDRPVLCERAGVMAARGTLADRTTRLRANGTPLHHFNCVSAFAEYAVIPEASAIRIREEVPLDAAALISCAVVTGVGAVFNTAGVEPGATVAVWGCGGIGLNVVQGARLAGASSIIAVDVRPEKLALAERLGATAVVDAREGDAAQAVIDASRGGVDYAFEALGTEATVQAAWRATGAGGTTVVVGLLPKGSTLTIDPSYLGWEKTLKGCYMGSPRLPVDVPRLVELYLAGDLRLDDIVSHRLPLAELPAALARLRSGEAVRQLVIFDGA
jgi:S-(hydroxymethyl)glutathione dehydrogenase/alcohol dehydrogenase